MARFVDSSEFPVVNIVYPPSMTQADMEELVEEMEAVLRRGQPFVYVADIRSGFLPDARQRDTLAAHYEQRRDDWGRLCLGGAAVQKEATRRQQHGIAVAIEWKSPFPFPRAEFTDIYAAQSWVKEKLTQAGI